MKRYSGYFYFLLLGSVVLLLINCYLFAKNRVYKSENRELILKNDSLIAVTIELKRQIIYPESKTVRIKPVSNKK